jgi:transcriptional regulator with XRE-family HTH domain
MNESIGARLKQARDLRRLTIQQVSEITKVRPHYLQALENDDLSAIPSVAQARGFLRIYAEFLELTPADLVPPARSADTGPATRPSASSSVISKTTSREVASVDKPARPGFLTNFLNRFKRPADGEAASMQTGEPGLSVESEKVPEEKPFIPARVSEELPEIPVPVIVTQPSEIKVETETGQVTVQEITPKTTHPKKTPSRPRKSSAQVNEKIGVKKKAGG